MTGIVEIEELLRSMRPEIMSGEYVFCTVDGKLSDYMHIDLLSIFHESEGLTLVLEEQSAIANGFEFSGVFKQITLTVHSSLDAVGLTAAVSTKLTEKGISANVIAAYYHDHIFVRSEQAEGALAALQELG